MSRYLLGLHAGCSEPGVHSALVKVHESASLPGPKFILGMFQPFPLELCKWLSKVGDRNPGDTQFFGEACRLIISQFVVAAYATIREAGLKPELITAIGCDTALGSLEESRRMRALAGWGPGMDISKGTGISVVALQTGCFQGREQNSDPVFCDISRKVSKPCIHIHLGGTVRLFAEIPGHKPVYANLGPCGSLFEVLYSSKKLLLNGAENFSKMAVQGTCEETLLGKWKQSSVRFSARKNRDDFAKNVLEDINRSVRPEQDSANILCTGHHFVVSNIMDAFADLRKAGISGPCFLSGPQAKNGFLRHLLALAMPNMEWLTSDGLGIPSVSFDAYARALAAGMALAKGSHDRFSASDSNYPSAAFYPGNSESWASCLRWMNGDSRKIA